MRIKTALLFIFLAGSVSAQEMWGISNSNYSGNMGIFLNPSSMVGAPYKYEFFLIGADLFGQNSYMYSPSDRKIITRSIFGTVPKTQNWFDNFPGGRQNGFAHTLVIGPSYINSSNKKKSWGIHTAYRNEASVLDVPADFAKYIFEEYNFQPFNGNSFSTGAFSAQWMRWFELGGTYGKVLLEEEKHYVKWAATANLLVGFNGLYIDARNIDYTIVDSSLTVINSMDAEIGEAHNYNEEGMGSIFPIRGLGLSTTLGATYIHKRHPGSYECGGGADLLPKYDYRVGLSIIDLGFIRYFNQDRILTLNTASPRNLAHLDSVPFVSIGYLTDYLDTNINGALTIEDKGFSMFTPAALSLQFDYAVAKNIYANLSWVNRIHYNVKEVARPNQLALAARYEKRKWEANLNYTLFEYDKSAMGVGFRYAFFVIGTDRLFEWLGVSDVQSFDFFFGLKFTFCDKPFKKADCPAYMED